jgi:hypothetical protein
MAKTNTPPVEPTGEPEAIPATPVPTPAPALPGTSTGTLDDLQARVTDPTASTNPAAAIRALGAAVDPTEATLEKRGRGRPKKGASSSSASSPNARTSAAPGAGTPRGKRTNAELEAENQAYKARLDIAAAQPLNADDLKRASETVQGMLALGNMLAEMSKAPEFIYTDPERKTIGDAFAEPIAPYLAKLGAAQPWVVAVGTLAMLTYPKYMLYLSRKELDAKGEVKIMAGTPAVGDEAIYRDAAGNMTPVPGGVHRPGVDIPRGVTK